MISLLRIEFYKLWTKKSILSLFFIVLCCNAGLLYYEQMTQQIPISAYDHLQQDLMKLPNEKRYEYVRQYYNTLEAISVLTQLQTLQIDPIGNQDMISYLKAQHPDIEKNYGEISSDFSLTYTSSIELETALFHEIDQEFEVLHAYHETLNEIQEKAVSISHVSIFASQHSFSNQNIMKSANDFQGMETLEPVYQLQKPIMDALHFSFSDLLIILLGLGIVSSMILDEKQKGLLALVKTTIHGDLHTMGVKFITMMISMGIASVILYGSNLILLHHLCHIGDLLAPLISLSDFSLTTLPHSIITFCIIFLCTKWLSACVIGGLMLCTAIVTKYKLGCFLWIFGVLGIEWLLFVLCDLQGPYAIFKQLNLIAFLDTASLYERYHNLNLFGNAVTYHTCALCLLVCLLILFAFLTCLSFHKIQDVSLHQVTIPSWLPRPKRKHACSTSLFLQEAYKVLWVQKGCFLILFYGILIGMMQHHQSMILSQEERNWTQYATQIQSKTPEEVEAFFQSQETYFSSLHKRSDEIEKQYHEGTLTRLERDHLMGPLDLQLSSEPTFQAVQERYAYVLEDEHREFIDPFGYEQLFMKEETYLIPWCILLVTLMFLLSDLICTEYQHDTIHLISTTRKGRTHLFFHKAALSSCIGTVLMLITMGFILHRISTIYELTSWSVAASSLPQFSHLPSSLTFTHLLFFDVVMKLLSCFVVIGTLMALSHVLKHMRAVLCMSCFLFIIPLLLHMMGFTIFDFISLKPLITITYELTQNHLILLSSSILLSLLVMMMTFVYAHHKFHPTRP